MNLQDKGRAVKGSDPATSKSRALIICDGHPALICGGCESAAYDLYTELNARKDWEAWFLGCNTGDADWGLSLCRGISQPFGDRDYVYTSTEVDRFTFANRDLHFPAEFSRLLDRLAPDVVHFHGFAMTGVDALAIARRAAPDATLVLTVRDFAALCGHNGAMVTRLDRRQCHGPSLTSCARCFPEKGIEGVYGRDQYIRRCLAKADQVVAPDRFLRDQLVAWGVAAERTSVISDLIRGPAELRERRDPDGFLRVGFFGKVTPLQGLGVLIDAARHVETAGTTNIRIQVHGALVGQSEPMHLEAKELLGRAPDNVTYMGPYDGRDVGELMGRTDVIVVPSIWRETAPSAFRHAVRNQLPVIVSDACEGASTLAASGAGFWFPRGDSQALADLLQRLAAMPHLLFETYHRPRERDVVADHIALYNQRSDFAIRVSA